VRAILFVNSEISISLTATSCVFEYSACKVVRVSILELDISTGCAYLIDHSEAALPKLVLHLDIGEVDQTMRNIGHRDVWHSNVQAHGMLHEEQT
jgi:hypothetical protein